MADFEAPSFSLGLDDGDLFDSEPQTSSVSEDDDYETLIVDDSEPEYSEPEYSDPYPRLKRLRRVFTADVTTTTKSSSSTISAKPDVELNSRPIVDDENDHVFCLQEDRLTEEHLHTKNPALSTSSKLPNMPGASTNQPGNKSQTPRRRFLLIVSDSDSDDPSVNHRVNDSKCNVSESIDISTTESPWKDFRSEKSAIDLDDSFPPALRYFFHDDQRIQELVQSRLPNFSPLCNVPNRDLEQPSTSEIDYMGQFSCSKQAARNIEDKKSSTRSKISRKEKIEETSQGWVNPKLCVDKGITKGDTKRNVHAIPKSAGYWLTGPDGKRVYVGKKGQELTGRVAYMQYKKESGTGFKKAKRKSATKKKK